MQSKQYVYYRIKVILYRDTKKGVPYNQRMHTWTCALLTRIRSHLYFNMFLVDCIYLNCPNVMNRINSSKSKSRQTESSAAPFYFDCSDKLQRFSLSSIQVQATPVALSLSHSLSRIFGWLFKIKFSLNILYIIFPVYLHTLCKLSSFCIKKN